MAEEKQFEPSPNGDEVQENANMEEEMKKEVEATEEKVQDASEETKTEMNTEENKDGAKEEKKQASSNEKTSEGSNKKKSSGSKKSKKTIKGLEMELKAQSEIIDDLSAKVKAAEEANAQAQDKYQRLMAEFENMRKRTEKEAKHMYDVGAKEVLEKLLPVVDNFERAQMSLTEEQKEDAFVQGIDKIYRQLLDYLKTVKVEPMNAEGQEFNPDLHNAVMHVEDEDYDDNVVVEELQKGYMYKEEVLRHSMVKVAN